MSAKTFIVDGGGAARRVKQLYAVDSGGTTRRIRRAYVIDSGGSARLVFTQTDVLAVSAAATQFATNGYLASPTTGSISPNTLTDGIVVERLDFNASVTPYAGQLNLTGFAANPGAAYLLSVRIAGPTNGVGLTANVTLLGSAATFSYASGRAIWSWSSGVHWSAGGIYTAEITRG